MNVSRQLYVQIAVTLGAASIALFRQQGPHPRPAAEWRWYIEHARREGYYREELEDVLQNRVFPWSDAMETANFGFTLGLSILVPLGLFALLWAPGRLAVIRRCVAGCAFGLMAMFSGPAAVGLIFALLDQPLSLEREAELGSRWLLGPAAAAVALIAARWLPQPTVFRNVLVCAGAGVVGGVAGSIVLGVDAIRSYTIHDAAFAPHPGLILLMGIVGALVASPYSGLWGGLVGAALASLREPTTISVLAVSSDRDLYRQPAIPFSESTDDRRTREATVAKLVSTAGTITSVFVCVATVLMGQTPYAREMGLLVCSSLAVVVITACARAAMIGVRAS